MWGSSAAGAGFSLAVSIVGMQVSSEAGGAGKDALFTRLAIPAGYSVYCWIASAENTLQKEAQAFNGYDMGWDRSLLRSVFFSPGLGEV